MHILAIETSCDETAISIVDFWGSKKKPLIKILSNIVSSQVKLHAKFGGVVPNLAKREHQRNLAPILLAALKGARLREFKVKNQNLPPRQIHGLRPSKAKQLAFDSKLQLKIQNQLKTILEREPELLKRFNKFILPIKPPDIDAIAVTNGPGLAPALWVGVNFAKALACLWDKPIIPVNHMEGHLYSALLQKSGVNFQNSSPRRVPGLCPSEAKTFASNPISNFKFPALALLVSGGHTELVLMRGYGKYKIIGETLDDAAGEAFDKVARLLGLGYPGGPEISAQAEISRSLKFKSLKIKLPRPMINSKDYNFSFSGLKTAVLYLIRDLTKKHPIKKIRPLVAKEFQDAVVDVLIKKTILAAKAYKAKTILLGGGVAANKLLRQKLAEAASCEPSNVECQMSNVELTGDNALMIALAAYFSRNKKIRNLNLLAVDANLRLKD